MSENIKVLQICSYYTGTKLYHNLFTSLSEMDVKEKIYVFTNTPYQMKEDVNYSIDISECYSNLDRAFFHLKHGKVLKDITSKYDIEKFDIMHAHSLFSNGYIAYKLNKKYNIPYVVAVRDTDVNIFFKKMIHLRRLGLEILKEANKIVFLSKSYREQVIEKYVPEDLKDILNNKVSIIPNGIDKFWFDNIGFPKQKNKKYLRLLQVGLISKRKNIQATIKAIEILIEKGYNVKLDVVGKIRDQNIFNKIKDLDYVNYLGYKSKEELRDIYRDNDIFVLPSITETFGLVYAEAISQGLPVIYTRGQGFDGQFEEGTIGYSVDCMNSYEIADNIIKIIENYHKLSKACLEKVNKFDWEEIAVQYLEIYDDCKKRNYKS